MLPNALLVIILTLVGYVTAKELSIKTDGDRVILGYRTAHPVFLPLGPSSISRILLD